MSRGLRSVPGLGGPTGATVWLIVVTGLVRLVLAVAFDLCYGESYFSAYVRRPELSYFDHPPLPFWLATLSSALAGGVGPLAVRLPFVLMFSGTTWLLFVVGRRLWGPWAGFHAALLANVTPALSIRAGFWLGPDGPLMFFWLAAVWALIPLLLDPPERQPVGARRLAIWVVAGACLGLGLLSKYSALLLVPGVFLFVVFTSGRRRILLEPGPWLALAVAGLLFSPVIVWNASHDWISFLWQGHRGVAYRGVRLDWLAWNVFGQTIELGPWLWVAIVVECVGIVTRWSHVDPARRLMACLGLPPVLLFTAISSYAPIGNHFYWGMGGYLLLLLPLADTVQRGAVRGGVVARRWRTVCVAAGVVLMALLLTHTMTGWGRAVPGVSRAIAGNDDPTLECIDYAALAPALAERGLLGRRDLFLFTDRWYQSGKVEWATNGVLPVLCFAPADQRGWAVFAPSEPWVGHEGIFITVLKRTEASARQAYGEYCATLEALHPVVVTRGGRPEITLHLYRCQRLLKPYPRPYG